MAEVGLGALLALLGGLGSGMTSDGGEMRPDGRAPTPQMRTLRVATRALRYHLAALPIDYDLDASGDRFLAGLSFMFARQRYDCADSMIGAGFGGTVLGSIARSLFIDGLRWLWIGVQPERRRTLLGSMLEERNRICVLLEETDASCPILARWFMPVPVMDLTGHSLAWLDAPTMPNEEELLNDFLTSVDFARLSLEANGEHSKLLRQARWLLDVAGLRGAVMVLSHAGHGNYLGLQSSLTQDGTPGHDLRPDHEALFMEVAAVGVTTTLLGTAAAIPELWPSEVQQQAFLERAVELVTNVTTASSAIHGLVTSGRTSKQVKKHNRPHREKSVLRPCALLAPNQLLPDVNSAGTVVREAEVYNALARSLPIRAWDYGQPSLHSMLAYGGGHSHLQTVMSTYDQPGSAVVSIFAARMLLEEAARMLWRFSVSEKGAFEARAKQFFDEYRARRKKTIDMLVGSGVSRANAERIMAMPPNVHSVTSNTGIAKGRSPLPKISTMLRELGAPYPEPGWIEVAYSLLSQVTHSTPIGHLHTVRFQNGMLHGNELSPEMLSLGLDTACLGSAHLIGLSAVILTDMSREALRHREDLLHQALIVHNAARLVHGLD